jgi:hypothetical protein
MNMILLFVPCYLGFHLSKYVFSSNFSVTSGANVLPAYQNLKKKGSIHSQWVILEILIMNFQINMKKIEKTLYIYFFTYRLMMNKISYNFIIVY